MWAGWVVLVLSSLSLARSVQAQDLALQFRYPRGVVVDSFLFTYHVSTDAGDVLRGFRVPVAHAPVCGSSEAASDTERRCARPPACTPHPVSGEDVLGPGLYSFQVQAERDGETSDGSNWAMCQASPECRWDCTALEVTNTALREAGQGHPLQPPPSSPPMPIVNTAERDALEERWRTLHQQIPRAPVQPVLATPPT